MAIAPLDSVALEQRLRLRPFDARYAPRIAGWVSDETELFQLAPRTPPPLTAMKVLGWKRPGRRAYVVTASEEAAPVGYGEVNLLDQRRREFWLGHLVVDPGQRGRGIGTAMVRLLIEEAIRTMGARRVSLVVFPANASAIRCYRAAGMRDVCHEYHVFLSRRRQAMLLRMAVDA